MKVCKKELQAFVSGFLWGCIIFISVFGIEILNPENVSWITSGKGDLVQSYIGWCYYRESPWTLPLGHIAGLFYDLGGITLINTDSIPIMALFFKLLSPLLPDTFQYLGIWELLCMGLQGGFASLILYKYIKSVKSSVLGSTFFIFAVPFFFRMFGHCALSGHFIVLAAWCMWTYRIGSGLKESIIKWSILASVAILIHPYLVIMVGVLMAVYMLDMYIRGKQVSVIWIPVITILSAAIVFSLMGGFYGLSSGINNFLLGQSSANIITWFDPNGNSSFMRDLPNADVLFPSEGMNYLGVGIILLFPLVLYRSWKYIFGKEGDKSFWNKLLMCALVVVTFVISCFPYFYFGDKLIFSIPLSDTLYKIFDVFQSNGRFMWLLTYGVMIYSIICFYELGSKIIQKMKWKRYIIDIMLIVLIVIQVIDVSPLLISKHERFKNIDNVDSIILKSDFWDELFAKIDYVDFCYGYKILDTQPIEVTAIGTGVDFNEAYCARSNVQEVVRKSSEVIETLKAGSVKTDTAYIITDVYELPTFLKSELVNVYSIEGYYVVVPKEIEIDTKWNQNKLNIIELEIEEASSKINNEANDLLLTYSCYTNENTATYLDQVLHNLEYNCELDINEKEFASVFDMRSKKLLKSSINETWVELGITNEDISENIIIKLASGKEVLEGYSGYLGATINNRYVWGLQGEINMLAIDLDNNTITSVSWIQDGKMYIIDNFQYDYEQFQ